MLALADRVVRVRLLLDTLNDYLPTPHSALLTDSGPSPSRYVPCGACSGRGERRVPGGWQLCLLCDGRGERRREPHDEPWDAYVKLPLADAAALPREPPLGRKLEDEVYEQTYGWERARKFHDRHGSYAQIRRQLGWLSEAAPVRYRLVRTVLVEHQPRELEERMHVELQLGVVMIARRIHHPRVPPWLMDRSEAGARRNTIAALAADGFTAGEIAKRIGLPKEAVRRKLKRIGVGSASRRNPQPGDARRVTLASATP